jgi:hypothetical protein
MTGSILFGWMLSVIWWAALSPSAREEITDHLVIPPGTADSIARGAPITFIPNELSLRPGSRLVVVNNDSAEHEVGNAVIPPGATAELSAPEEGEGFYCTIHPSGFLGVDITERPNILSTIVPALGIGVPLGLVTAGAAWVGRKLNLDEPEDGDSPDA